MLDAYIKMYKELVNKDKKVSGIIKGLFLTFFLSNYFVGTFQNNLIMVVLIVRARSGILEKF